jgi:hypothetical protein
VTRDHTHQNGQSDTVLWASDKDVLDTVDQEPKASLFKRTKWWGFIAVMVGMAAVQIIGIRDGFRDVWSSSWIWRKYIFFAVIGGALFWVYKSVYGKDNIPRGQIEFRKSIVMEHEILLYDEYLGEDMLLTPSDIKGVVNDYSNGAPVLRLILVNERDVDTILYVPPHDIDRVKALVQKHFVDFASSQAGMKI